MTNCKKNNKISIKTKFKFKIPICKEENSRKLITHPFYWSNKLAGSFLFFFFFPCFQWRNKPVFEVTSKVIFSTFP